jgi:putative oxidoreductase
MENPIIEDGGLAERWSPQALSVLRIVSALLFLNHGTSKILAFPVSTASNPPPWTQFWVAGMLELVGGFLLLIGLFSRPVALLLSGEMAIAYWLVHAPQGPFPILNGGEAAILFCFVFLFFAFEGPGPWSVDSSMKRRGLADAAEGYSGFSHSS